MAAKPSKLNEKKGGIHVPIYDLLLEVVVTDDIKTTERRRKDWYDIDPSESWGSFCHHGSRFGIFFRRDKLTHNTIAHEIFHATHRMLAFLGDKVKFSLDNQEPHAYLQGYLAGEIYKLLDEWKEKIKHED